MFFKKTHVVDEETRSIRYFKKTVDFRKMIYVMILLFISLILGMYFITENLIVYRATIHSRPILQLSFFLASFVLIINTINLINLKFFLKLIISYVLYWFISYFVLISQNLNNKNFNILAFRANNFFEVAGIKYLTSILLLASLGYFFKIYIKDKGKLSTEYFKFFNVFSLVDKTNIVIAILLSIAVIQDSKITEYFLSLFNTVDFQSYFKLLIYRVPMAMFIIILIGYSFWDAVEGIHQNRIKGSLAIISSFLFALIFNYGLQYGIKTDAAFMDLYLFPGSLLFQTTILSLLYITIYCIINRYWLSTIFIIFSSISISIANSIKANMRSEPLLITDFHWVTQLDLIFSFLNSSILLFASFLLLSFVITYIYVNKRYLKGKIFLSFCKRVILLLTILSIYSSIFFVFSSEKEGRVIENIPVISRLNNMLDISYMGHMTNARYKSVLFVWIKQLTKPVMERPKNYSESKVDDIVNKYQVRADEINEERLNFITDGTVIFILSESLSNPTRIEGVNITRDVLKNIEDIKSSTTSGLMKSDGYGGGTANMEIQTLTGLPYYNVSPSVSVMNTEIIPKMDLLPSISDTFNKNNRLVIHLGDTKTYSRFDVYNRLNFESFIANEENAIKPTASDNYGLYPSDESTYQNVLDNLNNRKSQFFNVITFQNHVPWAMHEPVDIVGHGVDFSDKENEELTNYARLINKTDEVTKEFLDKLNEIDKKITVVFYGDHLPSLYPQTVFEDDPENQYLTDFFIWSNWNSNQKKYTKVNSSDLPALLLEHTDSKVSPYYALLTDVLKNASIDKETLNSDQQEIADDLKIIQYDLMAGNKYLNKYRDFFEIK